MAKRCMLAGRLVVAAVPLLLFSGCDRPFVEISEPEIEIVEPDLTEVLTATRIRVRVRATSFRAVDRVLLQGMPMDLDPETGLWTQVVDLASGLNELVVTAFDVQDVAAQDTAIAVVFAPQFTINAPNLPQGLGDHAAILTAGNELLVTGGSFQVDGDALDEAYISSPAGAPFEQISSKMLRARLGHTMTNLPDGRVLIVGGAVRGTVNDVLVLVERAEVFDPVTRAFTPVSVGGDPIRRVHHTATGENGAAGFILDLFGGRGDIQYRPSPLLGVRDDIRSFTFRNDSLIAFTAAPGPILGPSISGHTQTAITAVEPFLPTDYQIHGTHFGQGFEESISFTVDFRDPLGLIVREVGKTLEARTHHVTAALADGLLITLGGSRQSRDLPIDTIELYVHRRRQFLTVPIDGPGPLRRSGHTATKLADGRIMIVGGFITGGNSTSLSEYLLSPSN